MIWMCQLIERQAVGKVLFNGPILRFMINLCPTIIPEWTHGLYAIPSEGLKNSPYSLEACGKP